MNIFSLEGETALITGGGSGLGLGIAQCFVSAGARVILVGRTKDTLRTAVSRLGSAASYIEHDVTDLDGAETLMTTAESLGGAPVSILINNAGIHLKKPAIETDPHAFEQVIRTHVSAAQALCRAVLPGMLSREQGSILFISSMAGLFGIPNVSAYSAAKTALIGYMRSLSTEVSPRGVRVNVIAPGWIDSRMMRHALAGDDMRRNKILDRTPMRRFGEPTDIGWAAVYLSSPAAKFVTGTTLAVDGGAHIGF